MRRAPFGPLLSLSAVLVTTLLLGNVLTVEARGRVMDDWNNVPIAGAQIRLGARQVTSDADGNFVFGDLPRGAMLNVRATTYRAQDVAAGNLGEVRMEPLTLNLTVLDSKTGDPVKSPEVHNEDGTFPRYGTESGDLAIAHPGRDVNFLVCATGHATATVHTTLTRLSVKLDPDPAGKCPVPAPSPSPSPTPEPSPSPSASPTPTPSATP